MKKYPSYAEAKIANPQDEILTNGKEFGNYGAMSGFYYEVCSPADHCSTLAEFLDAGYKLVEGDAVITVTGSALFISDKNTLSAYSERNDGDIHRHILRAAALNGGCKVPEKFEQEWVNGIPPVGTECEFHSNGFNDGYEWCIFHGLMTDGRLIIERKAKHNNKMVYCQPFDPDTTSFRPLETPEQKHKREWVEAAEQSLSHLDGAWGVCTEHLEAIYDAGLACKPE